MYLSEMIDAVEKKTGKQMFADLEEKAEQTKHESVVNLPEPSGEEPPDGTENNEEEE